MTSSLASNGATVLSTTDHYALHYASCEPKILSMIITEEQSVLVCTKEMIGNTPLHYAILAYRVSESITQSSRM